MPSPFPGMDPYVEARSIWPDVHASLITYICEILQPQLRPKHIRATRRMAFEVYALALRDKLPNCRIPLRAPDADAVLDLTHVFGRCYDVGGYDLLIDYTQPPPVSLSDEESAWLDNFLIESGARFTTWIHPLITNVSVDRTRKRSICPPAGL